MASQESSRARRKPRSNKSNRHREAASRPSDTSRPRAAPSTAPPIRIDVDAHAPADFSTGADYIPFDLSDDDDDGDDKDNVPGPARPLKRPAARMVDDGDDDGYASKKQRTDASSRITPWAADVDWRSCRNLAEMMHKEVRAFAAYIAPTRAEHAVRGMVVALIVRAIQGTWRDARVEPFGSYATGLYLPLGDIDLVVESRAMGDYDKRQVLYRLAQVLRKANVTDNVQVIARARVPIIKFITSYGRFAVDISLNQGNGVKAGQVVNRLLKELPALQSLVMVIKLFLSQRSMNEVYTGGLGSYSIVCMAVSFLQMHPKIRAGEIDPSENMGVLVMEFFELYGHYFNYDNTGISLRGGGTYFSKQVRGWADPRRPCLLSIEDPIDTSNDIARSSFNIARVRKTLAGAHEVLTAAALMRSRVLVSRAHGEYTDLRGRGRTREYGNESILGSVMGVTQETLNHRRMVRQLYEQNVLQRMLGLPLHRSPTTTTHLGGARAVEAAWGEADMDVGDSDVEEVARPPSPEESRYPARYARKRRRVDTNGRHVDAGAGAVFVAESEEEGQVVQANVEARRAYWAGKSRYGGDIESD